MKINNLAKDEVLRSLVATENGLTEEEAKKRFLEFGPNEIQEVKKKPLILRFISQFTHFLAILLWIAAVLSFLSEYLHPGEGMLTLGFAIIAVIVINAIFTFIQEYRTEKALVALKKLLPFYVKVMRGAATKEIHAREVVPGDIIMLSEGDKIPADARLIETTYLIVNNAPLTGESEPVSLQYEPVAGELIESRNIAFAGTTVVSGSGKGVVYATGMKTEFGRIAHLTSAVEAGLSPLQKEIVKATRLVATIAAAVGIFFFLLGFVIGRSFWDNFIFAIGITVALIPEGMLPTMTLSLAMGGQRMAKRKALIKTLTSVETLGSVTVICTDKTGTLTQNKMSVIKAWVNDRILDVKDMKKDTAFELLKIAYLCNNAYFENGQFRGDPTEVALFKVARETIGDGMAERVSEIPFDSERKRMTTLNVVDGKTFAFTKGAMEGLFPLCRSSLINGEIVPNTGVLKEKVMDSYHALMDMGLRVLSFAYKEIGTHEDTHMKPEEIENNMVFVGLIGLEDPPRPEVKEAISKCNEAGI
ncbi:MAG TPA: cation-transporting P-type ATPase, partial [Thermodesulfovibrionales bacterium]|nr:cation-transporting P-type ATPase [Thermodesulfovibrionales bacterium]